MFKKAAIWVCILFIGLTTSVVPSAIAEEEKILNIYNWFEYLLPATIKDFETETGIKINLDTFEGYSILETKLLTGKSGYDVVFPGATMAKRLIKLDTFKKLNKSRLSNYKNLDPVILSRLAEFDKGNNYGVPYGWGTTGIGINVEKVKKRLPNTDLRSLDFLFKPENISKLADCGVAFRDADEELIPIALNYLGLDPHSVKKTDLKKVEDLFKSIRPYIRHFNNSALIEELATGELCACINYSGDVLLSGLRVDELKNGIVIDYLIPKEGSIIYFDFVSIPADAKHPKNAHKFLNFMMRPKVMAEFTNYFFFPNGNAASFPYINDEVKVDPDIYPSKVMIDKLFVMASNLPKKERRKYTRLWTKFKANK